MSTLKKSRVYWITLSLATLAGCAWLGVRKPATPDLAEQIGAVSTSNRAAKSYAEWIESGHTPDAVFEDLRAAATPARLNETCAQLAKSTDSALALFQNVLEESADLPELTCRSELLTRIDAYQRKGAQALEARIAARKREPARYHPHPPLNPRLTTNHKLTNRIVKVDAAAGPIYSPFIDVATMDRRYGTIHDGGLNDREINLTFDDGPLPHRTDKVLAILQSAGITANFYEMGKNAYYFPELTRQLKEAGNVVGSHSIFHPIMTHPSEDFAMKEILCGSYFVGEAAGEWVPFFRFPGGAWTDATIKITRDHSLAVFFWDLDSTDWKEGATADSVYSQVLSEIERKNKGIIVFHDVQSHTNVALPYILDELYERNFTTVTYMPEAAPATSAEMPDRCEKTRKLLEETKAGARRQWGA